MQGAFHLLMRLLDFKLACLGPDHPMYDSQVAAMLEVRVKTEASRVQWNLI